MESKKGTKEASQNDSKQMPSVDYRRNHNGGSGERGMGSIPRPLYWGLPAYPALIRNRSGRLARVGRCAGCSPVLESAMFCYIA